MNTTIQQIQSLRDRLQALDTPILSEGPVGKELYALLFKSSGAKLVKLMGTELSFKVSRGTGLPARTEVWQHIPDTEFYRLISVSGKKLKNPTQADAAAVRDLMKAADDQGYKVTSNAAKPDAPKPDAPKPDAPKPDAPKTDAPKPDAPKPDAPKPDALPDPNAKVIDIKTKKQLDVNKQTADEALDSGAAPLPKDVLLPNAAEPPSKTVARTLRDDPVIAPKWNNLSLAEKSAFWAAITPGKKFTIITLIALAAAGSLVGDTPKEKLLDPEASDAEEKQAAADKAAADKAAADKAAADKAAADKAAKDKTDTDSENQAAKTTDADSSTAAAADTDEMTSLRAEIDQLIQELSTSQDPNIQARLAAVKKKLAGAGQAVKVSAAAEQGGWRSIGNDYEKWVGPAGKDPKTGESVPSGRIRSIDYDSSQEDEFSKLSRPELVRQARINAQQAKDRDNQRLAKQLLPQLMPK